MEQPCSGVVSDEPESDTLAAGDLDSVATHGVGLALVDRRVEFRVVRRVIRRALDELELVSVDMAVQRQPFVNTMLYTSLRFEATHKGCLPASPFCRTMSMTSRWLSTNAKGPYASWIVAFAPRVSSE